MPTIKIINREKAARGLKHLMKSIEILGGRKECAKLLGVSVDVIGYWMWQKYVPQHHINTIESLTNGKVTAKQLRPDLFR